MTKPTFESLLNTSVALRKKSASHTWLLYNGENSLIYKGPLKSVEIDRIKERAKMFTEYKTPFIAQPHSIVEFDNGFFVTFDVDFTLPIEIKMEYGGSDNRGYRIATIARVNDYITSPSRLDNEWYPENMEKLLATYLHMFILECKDVTLGSIYLNDPKVPTGAFVFDYDGYRPDTKVRDDGTFYLNSNSPIWYSEIGPFYNNAAADLEEIALLQFDNNPGERIMWAAQKLRQYYITPQPPTIKPPTSEEFGHAVWKGMGNIGKTVTLTYSGYTLSGARDEVIKSLKSKDAERAMSYGSEIMMLEKLGGKQAVSNLFNTLSDYAVWQVGFMDLDAVVSAVKLLTDETRVRDTELLREIITILAACDTTEEIIADWTKYVDKGTLDFRATREEEECISSFKLPELKNAKGMKVLIPIDIFAEISVIDYNVKHQNVDRACMFYLSYMMQVPDVTMPMMARTTTPPIKQTNNPVYLVFAILERYLGRETVEVLSNGYFNAGTANKNGFIACALISAAEGIRK